MSRTLPTPTAEPVPEIAIEFVQQAEKLSHHVPTPGQTDGLAVEALFPARHDPVLVTADGNRLPAVPLQEAHKLNILKEELEDSNSSSPKPRSKHPNNLPSKDTDSDRANLRSSLPPTHTNPLFPPLPLYGPPSLLRNMQCLTFRLTSFILSLAFLSVIVLGALFTSIPPFLRRTYKLLTLQDPAADRIASFLQTFPNPN